MAAGPPLDTHGAWLIASVAQDVSGSKELLSSSRSILSFTYFSAQHIVPPFTVQTTLLCFAHRVTEEKKKSLLLFYFFADEWERDPPEYLCYVLTDLCAPALPAPNLRPLEHPSSQL